MNHDTTWTEHYLDTDGTEPRTITVHNRQVGNLVVKTVTADGPDHEIELEPLDSDGR